MTLEVTVRRRRGWVDVVIKLLKKPDVAFGLVIVALFYAWSMVEGVLQVVGALLNSSALGWALLPHNPFQPHLSQSLQPPSILHIMGTDDLGRDILSRVLYAAPYDALISLIVVGGGILIGGLIGMIAGFYGGGVEEFNMWLTDLFLAFPALILAMVIEATFGHGYIYAMIAMIVVWWPSYARLFRAETIRVRSMKYIDAALLSGLSRLEIIRRHIIRPALITILPYATLDLGNVILFYSMLSFLGLGQQPPLPEWGSMVALGLEYFPRWWWYSIMPGLVILIIAVATALVGDGLRDVIGGEERWV
ncbi:MAG: peptide ABC transporter permease [Caldivirga sp. JCHS_4]|jgi:ABC-type dipeptide/oligopeptide/nickel transport systems, permease components|nr:MAG: peptide ABC transporter permease [Caldivirga sp. JCHS_4]